MTVPNPLFVVCPSGRNPDGLATIIELGISDADVAATIVVGTGPGASDAVSYPGDRVAVLHSDARNYQTWVNLGWSFAAAMVPAGPYDLVIVNDDVVVIPGSFGRLGRALRSGDWHIVGADHTWRTTDGTAHAEHVRAVSGTYRSGGIPGWCFAVRGELARRGCLLDGGMDEQFEWYYGDDDLVRRVETSGGHVGIAEHVPVDHHHEFSASQVDWPHHAKSRDAVRYHAKWAGR